MLGTLRWPCTPAVSFVLPLQSKSEQSCFACGRHTLCCGCALPYPALWFDACYRYHPRGVWTESLSRHSSTMHGPEQWLNQRYISPTYSYKPSRSTTSAPNNQLVSSCCSYLPITRAALKVPPLAVLFPCTGKQGAQGSGSNVQVGATCDCSGQGCHISHRVRVDALQVLGLARVLGQVCICICTPTCPSRRAGHMHPRYPQSSNTAPW